jgi:hypothetical protein
VVTEENDSQNFFVYQVVISYDKHVTAGTVTDKSVNADPVETLKPGPQTQIGRKIPRKKLPIHGHLKYIIFIN